MTGKNDQTSSVHLLDTLFVNSIRAIANDFRSMILDIVREVMSTPNDNFCSSVSPASKVWKTRGRRVFPLPINQSSYLLIIPISPT